jgi:hypothetical protein
MLVMKKMYTTPVMDTLQAIGIISGFYAILAIVAVIIK